MNKNFLTIIALAKNEKDNITWSLNSIQKEVKTKHEILLVCSSKNDDTLPIARKLQKKINNLRVVTSTYGPGVINQTISGIELAKGNILVIYSTDRTDDSTAIDPMFQKILSGYDIVCPTRFSQGGKMHGKVTAKALLARLAGLSTPYILGIPTTDLTYSYKMFKKSVLNDIEIKSQGGFEFAEELLIKAYYKGFRITQVPACWHDRKFGKSNFKLIKWLPGYIYWYLWGLCKRLKLH